MPPLHKHIHVEEIEYWLREEDENRLQELWTVADNTRRVNVGNKVFTRGLLEISNYCIRSCAYCGLRSGNTRLKRYRMKKEEIIACAGDALRRGYDTVVMQAGEDYGIKKEWMAGIIRWIKNETPLAVTLSLGERPFAELEAWRKAGADRYLLRFETSDWHLYNKLHPPLAGNKSDRFAILRSLQSLGYEAGSGVMIGLPGQDFRSIARDIALFCELELDMVGVGPYIKHPETPLGSDDFGTTGPTQKDNVINSELITYKVIALTRIVCPEANIPVTTALSVIDHSNSYMLGMQRGANVIMPNITPHHYRIHYNIYPGKTTVSSECHRYYKQSVLKKT